VRKQQVAEVVAVERAEQRHAFGAPACHRAPRPPPGKWPEAPPARGERATLKPFRLTESRMALAPDDDTHNPNASRLGVTIPRLRRPHRAGPARLASGSLLA
jgi:hypothetical protein